MAAVHSRGSLQVWRECKTSPEDSSGLGIDHSRSSKPDKLKKIHYNIRYKRITKNLKEEYNRYFFTNGLRFFTTDVFAKRHLFVQIFSWWHCYYSWCLNTYTRHILNSVSFRRLVPIPCDHLYLAPARFVQIFINPSDF